MSEPRRPPDWESRERIVTKLRTNMLVEAAAGTGKTTSMVGRMIALLAEGVCETSGLAAVTFTRKAAAELRVRFLTTLEARARAARGEVRKRLQRAAEGVDRCFIGTIHAFCGRLLRERPVEAGIDVSFGELDESEDAHLRRRAWDDYIAGLYAGDSPVLGRLDDLGLDIDLLYDTYELLCRFPDVDEWVVAEHGPPDLGPALAALRSYARRMQKLAPSLPTDAGRDNLIPMTRLIPRLLRQAEPPGPAQIARILAEFRDRTIVQRNWPGGKKQALAEKRAWDDFQGAYAEPALTAWREACHAAILAAAQPAVERYDSMRRERGQLNFQDLLMAAAGLLRGRPDVRRYFQRRFTHLLVDEFQDTDPIQAEVMLLLTAEQDDEDDWRKCRPRPGCLFVVGDPKQSIYRFRRADIVTYNQVKQIIKDTGGETVELSANFRTIKPCIDWINRAFADAFPTDATDESPAYVPLQVGRTDAPVGDLQGIHTLPIPSELANKASARPYEAGWIARFIRRALDEELTVPRTPEQLDRGLPPEARPGDFLIVTRKTGGLSQYARALQDLGIPHQVTGGSALNEVLELRLLYADLRAATRPNDPLALIAALRSELFGVSDADLYAFKQAGGRFTFRAPVPEGLGAGEAFRAAFERLRRHAGWLAVLPPASALERILDDLGLPALAASRPGGPFLAGSLAKAVEILRSAQVDRWSVAEWVDHLGELVEQTETYDGQPVRQVHDSVVRVMNLHKVKGLEAPVVFLADPFGEWRFPVKIHIDRSAGAAQGYLAAYDTRGRQTLVAHPPNWNEIEARERDFETAEQLRLRYVAATRAGAMMIISQKSAMNHTNPWKPFAPFLEEGARSSLAPVRLDDPGPRQAPEADLRTLAPADVEAARAGIRDRWTRVSRPTYAISTVKKQFVKGSDSGPTTGEHGTEWGSAVHRVLQTVMQEPQADLEPLARAAVQDFELPAEMAETCVQTVRSLMRSEVWARAQRASRRQVEIPFELLMEQSPPEAGGVQTVLRGVIDLAFQEDGEWVIVDYKTDDRPGKSLKPLLERYMPQAEAYADAWRRCTGEPVKEIGLYFATTDQYVART